jgi:hypothetical protein
MRGKPPGKQVKLHQEGYRWRNDDGDEVTASWIAAENDDVVDHALDVNTRLRVEIENASRNTFAIGQPWQLQYRVNGGAWSNVDGQSDNVRSSGSPHIRNNETLFRNLLTGSSVNFTAAPFESGDGVFITGLAQQDHFEPEWCFQFRSADLSSGDVVEFQVTFDGVVLDEVNQGPPAVTVA